MAWTDLSAAFGFGTVLTSSQMQNLRDNLTALANGDSGAPSVQRSAIADDAVNADKIAQDAVTAYHITQNAVGAHQIDQNAVNQGNMDSGAIGRSELKDSFGTVSVSATNGTWQRITLAGGSHGFYPRMRSNISSGHNAQILHSASLLTSYVSYVSMMNGGGTTYMMQYYVQASPPYDLGDGEVPLFIFALLNQRGALKSIYAAPEAPWHYNGPTIIVPDFYGKDGKGYQRRRKINHRLNRPISEISPEEARELLDRLNEADDEIHEVDQKTKQADMEILPHPFLSAGKDDRVALLDPVNDETWKLAHLATQLGTEESLDDLFYAGHLVIDNIPLPRRGPSGVPVVGYRWRRSRRG